MEVQNVAFEQAAVESYFAMVKAGRWEEIGEWSETLRWIF